MGARRFGRFWLSGLAAGALGLAPVAIVVATASPSAATSVSDETTFRAAWTNAAETQIDLAADITLTCGGGGKSTRNSATALTLDGHGHTITQTCAGSGVLGQAGTGALTFSNVTITGGTAPAAQTGGIGAGGDLTLNNSSVTGNTQAGGAGTAGIGVNGSLTLNNSSVSDNHDVGASGGGGGVFATGNLTLNNSTLNNDTCVSNCTSAVSSTGTIVVRNSTISNSSATSNGTAGIADDNDTATVTLINSTVTNNLAGGAGGNGGVRASLIVLVYSTIVGNGGAQAANLGQNGGHPATQLTSFGSVVTSPGGGGPNCGNMSATTSNGYNFSDDASSAVSCRFNNVTDKVGATNNPNLGALANNGGPTQTRLPATGSPLIDGIPIAACQADGATGITTDQRGISRPQGPGCDIGAVEVQAAAALTVAPRFTG